MKILTCINIKSTNLIIVTAIFWMAFANFSFLSALINDYPIVIKNVPFLITVVFSFTAIIVIALSLFCFRRTIKPILILLLISTSLAAYFMDAYNVIIDKSMIRNVFETDANEALDLINLKMFVYLFLLGILPSILVYRANIIFNPFRQEILSRVKLIGTLLVLVLVLLFVQSAATTSFLRGHKSIRYYVNPNCYVVGLVKHLRNVWRASQGSKPLQIIGEDARSLKSSSNRRLIIMVVGEAARADKFSLNTYLKPTNPLLEKHDVVSFSNVRSCATLTAVSVPCMFSFDKEQGFDVDSSKNKDNVLDVLQRAGVEVLWRDNNSSSKNVADRVIYQDYRAPDKNTICEDECRDVGMLVGLQEYIDSKPEKDILIVLHQMGSHGPAYYKRYPKEFEKFTPTCQTNELSDCSVDEINNAYDNTILYTDYFLNEVIMLLNNNDAKFETAMFYISDHGESLGENGIYLHGMPNFVAPEVQRNIPAIVWLGSKFTEVNKSKLMAKKDVPLTHDNIVHSLLGLLEVESEVYDKDLDFIRN